MATTSNVASRPELLGEYAPIFTRYERLKSKYAARDAQYRKLYNFYEGYFWPGVDVRSKDGIDDKVGGIKLTVNRMYTTVRNYVNYMSQPPDVQVHPPREDEEARALADQNEKIIYWLWEENDIALRMMETAWYQSCVGAAVLKALPDPFGKKISITNIRPENVYVQPYGADYSRYRQVFIKTKMIGSELKEYYGKREGIDDETEYELVEYFDENQYLIFLAETRTLLKGIRHNWGFIPIVVIPGNIRPHQIGGHSDIEQAVGLNQYVNELFSYKADIIENTANPPLVLEGSKLGPAEIETGPGAIIEIESGGRAYYLVPTNNPALDQQMDLTLQHINDITGMPEPTLGRVQPSVESGAAIQSLLGGVSVSISARQTVLGVYLSKFNSYCLRLLERVYGNETLEITGEKKGTSFAMNIKGKDVRGYYKNKIVWRPGIYDYTSFVTTQLQLLGARLQSRYTTMENLGIRSPQDEMKRMLDEQRMDILTQMELQKQFRAPGEVQKERKGLEQGLIPESIAQQVPGLENLPPEELERLLTAIENGALETGEEALPTAVGAEGMGNVIPFPTRKEAPKITRSNVIGRLGKVKFDGKVYLTGEIAQGETSGKVTITITDAADKEKILAALKDYADRVEITVGRQPAGGYRVKGAR